jgi:error-prone DNA polymerase
MAGALNFNTIHRREALWRSELAMRPEGPLFDRVSRIADRGFDVNTLNTADSDVPGNNRKSAIRNPQSAIGETPFLKRMEGLELIEADLRKTGISIGKHPMAFLREELDRRGILSSRETVHLKKGQVASVAGAVIIRQRPMTANNVVFITLEDEFGFSNFVVMPDKFEEYRAVINQSDFLIVRGVFEERGMLKAMHFTTLTEIATEVVSHNFR